MARFDGGMAGYGVQRGTCQNGKPGDSFHHVYFPVDLIMLPDGLRLASLPCPY
jgi:hypothetical protein